MSPTFFQEIENILHADRIDAYRQDGVDHGVTLSRYLLNMALSESLYPTLQFAEIALRNAVHRELSAHCSTDAWYDSPDSRLTSWQSEKVAEAKDVLRKHRKPLTPGRVVAGQFTRIGRRTDHVEEPEAELKDSCYKDV